MLKRTLETWPDRFAVIDKLASKLSVPQICNALQVTIRDYRAAVNDRSVGKIQPTAGFDVQPFSTLFDNPMSIANQAGKAPKKRGRQGSKIAQALEAVPSTPTPAIEFAERHNVSLNVLRQAKRFIDGMPADKAAEIGHVVVRTDKATKTLMIWRSSTPQ